VQCLEAPEVVALLCPKGHVGRQKLGRQGWLIPMGVASAIKAAEESDVRKKLRRVGCRCRGIRPSGASLRTYPRSRILNDRVSSGYFRQVMEEPGGLGRRRDPSGR
jgi:hypothetical protein